MVAELVALGRLFLKSFISAFTFIFKNTGLWNLQLNFTLQLLPEFGLEIFIVYDNLKTSVFLCCLGQEASVIFIAGILVLLGFEVTWFFIDLREILRLRRLRRINGL